MARNKKLPELVSTIRVFDVDYNVVPMPLVDIKNYNGHIFHDEQRIEITDSVGFQYQLRTLWHELVHVAQHAVTMKNQDNEEADCDLVGIMINQVLQDNPALVAIYVKLSKGSK